MSVTKNIKVPYEFFVKERNQVYSPWRKAFWRELIQNSVDAGAKNIKVYLRPFEPTEKDRLIGVEIATTVSFSDDGPGMSRDVLEQVYMSLGATTKGTENVGGFGRARILTCFSHPRWLLQSQEWVCTSDETGSGYIVRDYHTWTRGLHCLVQVQSGLEELKDALLAVIGECELPDVNFFLDDKLEVQARFKRGMRGKRFAHATVYETDRSVDPPPNQLLVRVDGLPMFSRWLYGGSTSGRSYIVELDTATSRSCLSASRERPIGDFEHELNQLVTELARGNADAARSARPPTTMTFGENSLRESQKSEGLAVPIHWLNRASRQNLPAGPVDVITAMQARITSRKETMDKLWEQDKLDPLTLWLGGSGAVVVNNANGDNWQTLIKRDWNIERWMALVNREARTVAWYPSSRKQARLLKAWTMAVDHFMNYCSLLNESFGVMYQVGVIFQMSTMANCSRNSTEHEGRQRAVYTLTFNPYIERSDGELVDAYVLDSRDGLRELIVTAAHECCHVFHFSHDEVYAQLLTNVLSIVNVEDLGRRIRERL